jgi:hypothetical protein
MSTPDAAPAAAAAPARYRLVLEGELAPERAAWFGAVSLAAADGVTTMHVDIADQPALHGLLRRINDVNLRIIELAQVAPGHEAEA